MNPSKPARAPFSPRGPLAVAIIGALVVSAALAGCVVAPPSGQVLSRLPPDQGGASPSARPLTDAEKKRYDEIDKQVLSEQNEAMAADAWARYYAPYYAPPVVYGGYGGYYGGWGAGYYSPGYYPGWWW
ncbi:hypothetical protein B0G57_118116 [Trinickia symbiotica]|uniref:Lipoprotein n=1 Tax=Trinickia symbiotica TaxID=863227 RepID=A0A2N7WWW9_9BURK|nr:hypothetical protein [Trinickia symbiotica]PMS33959.1 hypothetical protein C0Z20_23925 [Trinickia symbiotica]PPK42576.1 hypothetical protein B0G57_118116 [Trinickia symbiotica]